MKVEFLKTILDIEKSEWDAINKDGYPFIKFDFLSGLEVNKCACPSTGWYPFHATIREKNSLIGVMPLYLKTNSQGEFIFDWAWADAYYRNGLDYYPKLISSIPFTPASGPRLITKDTACSRLVAEAVIKKIEDLSVESNFSRFHILLPNNKEIEVYKDLGLSIRTSNSYHWFNNDYIDFEGFLKDLTSRQRKNLKKEREKIISQEIYMERLVGEQISEADWKEFYNLYQITYLKRGMQGYLNLEFFLDISKKIPENIMMVVARDKKKNLIAGALNFFDKKNLYGRYWGAKEEYDSLHFETCYYQGIEFCINNKLLRFDPGVQGHHKIKRGFFPIETYSAHLIHDQRFRTAINNFLKEERTHIKSHNQESKELLPFKKEVMESIYSKKVV